VEHVINQFEDKRPIHNFTLIWPGAADYDVRNSPVPAAVSGGAKGGPGLSVVVPGGGSGEA
jgi:hypothetical protein